MSRSLSHPPSPPSAGQKSLVGNPLPGISCPEIIGPESPALNRLYRTLPQKRREPHPVRARRQCPKTAGGPAPQSSLKIDRRSLPAPLAVGIAPGFPLRVSSSSWEPSKNNRSGSRHQSAKVEQIRPGAIQLFAPGSLALRKRSGCMSNHAIVFERDAGMRQMASGAADGGRRWGPTACPW